MAFSRGRHPTWPARQWHEKSLYLGGPRVNSADLTRADILDLKLSRGTTCKGGRLAVWPFGRLAIRFSRAVAVACGANTTSGALEVGFDELKSAQSRSKSARQVVALVGLALAGVASPTKRTTPTKCEPTHNGT